MAITDLTYTTWVVPAGWTAPAGYGRYGDIKYAIHGEYGSDRYTSLYVGYNGNFDNNFSTPTANVVVFGYYGQYNNRNGFIITFIGGADVTNTSLISWIESVGEMQGGGDTNYDVSVYYKGEPLGTVDPNNEGVIGCNGKTMEDDIIIRVSAMGGIKIINFTIGGTAYQAEEGMKWGGFVYSKYNTSNKFVVANGFIESASNIVGSVSYADNSYVDPYDIITDGYRYNILHGGGSLD